jgi:hypothetical protein
MLAVQPSSRFIATELSSEGKAVLMRSPFSAMRASNEHSWDWTEGVAYEQKWRPSLVVKTQ